MNAFEKSAQRIVEMVTGDDQINDQAVAYAKRKCAEAGCRIPVLGEESEEFERQEEPYHAFVQEYFTNLMIAATNLNRSNITE